MTDSNKEPYALVPEIALLASLPSHYQKRFEVALHMMHDALEEKLSWEQIAERSAISPYHFHRQFSQLFNETPGRYLSRIRLQYAVNLLMVNSDLKITQIAYQCGYSSSQAMAKALQRELGMTAKELRIHIQSGTPEETSQLLNRLSHPGEEFSLEQQLAQSMPSELIWYPARGMKIINMPDFDWDIVFETHAEKSTRFLVATPISELERSWSDISYTVCDWTVSHEAFDYYIPEGYYFCCDVYLVSDVAYFTAIERLFQQAEDLGYQIDISGCLVDMVRNIEMTPTGGVTFSFQIPIIV